MQRLAASIVTIALLMTLGSALAQGHGDAQPPRHGHVLLLGLVLDADGEVVELRKCVDLANAQALPINAHHDNVHMGRAGEALARAGHLVVPNAPLTPWNSCAELLAGAASSD